MSSEDSVHPIVEKDTLKEALSELLDEMPAFREWKKGAKPSSGQEAGRLMEQGHPVLQRQQRWSLRWRALELRPLTKIVSSDSVLERMGGRLAVAA